MFITLPLISIMPISISNWLIWQNLKEGTIIPRGFLTCKYGFTLGWAIKILYYIIILYLSFNYTWLCVLTIAVTWFISGWISTDIERKRYMNITFSNIIQLIEFNRNSSSEYIFSLILLPKWWFDLMPNSWKKDYYILLEKIKNQNFELKN